MGDLLGARTRAGDPKQIAEVREAAPKIVSIGAQPIPTAKQAPRLGAPYDERGFLEARDPRTMSPGELSEMGHQPMSPLQAIRAHCLDCCGGSSREVAGCMALRCPSWPFRMGSNPWRAPRSDEQRQAMRIAVAVSPRQTEVYAPARKTLGRLPPYPRRKLSKIGRHSSLRENSTVNGQGVRHRPQAVWPRCRHVRGIYPASPRATTRRERGRYLA